MSAYPLMFRLRQKFEAPRLDDVPAEVEAQLARLRLSGKVKSGDRVAVAVGSRGIANLRVIVRAVARHLAALGAEPFIVPAMGSHGGGTAQGQRQVLQSYGVTEAYVGCPLRATMETVVVCQTAEGFPVHFDRFAYEADHVVVVNRVKPHTRFNGPIESGLMKMMLIGLGKCEGASVYHRAILDYDFDQIIRSVTGDVFRNCRILAGVAILENAYDETALVEAVPPEAFESREKELLARAKQWMARLPFDRVDLLLIDRIGKNISGAGLDTNVVGRKYDDHKAHPGEFPKIKVIAIRGLTPESHGNAIGLGLAEFCKSRLLREADFEATRLNGIVSTHVSAAMTPLDYETDREILDVALGRVVLADPREARIVWIRNTLELDEMECSVAYLDEARARDDLEILSEPRPLPLDAAGNLPDLPPAARHAT